MKTVCFTVVLILPLLPAGAPAAELDEITIEVIDARASSVGDVMRNIEIPQYDSHRGRESESTHLMPAEQGHHRRGDHADDQRLGAESSHAQSREDAEESHDVAREEIDEAHDEAAVDHEDAHDNTAEDIDDLETPGNPEEPESDEAPEH